MIFKNMYRDKYLGAALPSAWYRSVFKLKKVTFGE